MSFITSPYHQLRESRTAYLTSSLLGQTIVNVSGVPAFPTALPASSLAYLLFDLLYLDGRSLLSLPYVDRRNHLQQLDLSGPSWWTPPYALDGRQLLEKSQALGYEGVVAKKLTSPYRPGTRSGEWLKVKVPRRDLLVIAGWMPSDIRADRIGSLVVARYDVAASVAIRTGHQQRLVYAGRVGTGFSQRMLALLGQLLTQRRIEVSPIDQGAHPRGHTSSAQSSSARSLSEN
jgi:bifunctional non-homologous end joining protein LigD